MSEPKRKQGNSGRPSGRGRSTDRKFDGVYRNARFTHTVASLVGHVVQVTVRDGHIYEGVLQTISQNMDLLLQAVHEIEDMEQGATNGAPLCTHHLASLLKSVERWRLSKEGAGDDGRKSPLHECMVFPMKEVVSLTARNVDLEYARRVDGFTDGAISARHHTSNNAASAPVGEPRQLVAWSSETEADDSIGPDDAPLENGENSTTGWDPDEMFKTNETRYGVKSTYKDDLRDYTMPLEHRDTPEYRKQQEDAKRIAQEIEQNPAYRRRVELENGDGDDDEEAKFSAVVRPNDRFTTVSSSKRRPSRSGSGNQAGSGRFNNRGATPSASSHYHPAASITGPGRHSHQQQQQQQHTTSASPPAPHDGPPPPQSSRRNAGPYGNRSGQQGGSMQPPVNGSSPIMQQPPSGHPAAPFQVAVHITASGGAPSLVTTPVAAAPPNVQQQQQNVGVVETSLPPPQVPAGPPPALAACEDPMPPPASSSSSKSNTTAISISNQNANISSNKSNNNNNASHQPAATNSNRNTQNNDSRRQDIEKMKQFSSMIDVKPAESSSSSASAANVTAPPASTPAAATAPVDASSKAASSEPPTTTSSSNAATAESKASSDAPSSSEANAASSNMAVGDEKSSDKDEIVKKSKLNPNAEEFVFTPKTPVAPVAPALPVQPAAVHLQTAAGAVTYAQQYAPRPPLNAPVLPNARLPAPLTMSAPPPTAYIASGIPLLTPPQGQSIFVTSGGTPSLVHHVATPPGPQHHIGVVAAAPPTNMPPPPNGANMQAPPPPHSAAHQILHHQQATVVAVSQQPHHHPGAHHQPHLVTMASLQQQSNNHQAQQNMQQQQQQSQNSQSNNNNNNNNHRMRKGGGGMGQQQSRHDVHSATGSPILAAPPVPSNQHANQASGIPTQQFVQLAYAPAPHQGVPMSQVSMAQVSMAQVSLGHHHPAAIGPMYTTAATSGASFPPQLGPHTTIYSHSNNSPLRVFSPPQPGVPPPTQLVGPPPPANGGGPPNNSQPIYTDQAGFVYPFMQLDMSGGAASQSGHHGAPPGHSIVYHHNPHGTPPGTAPVNWVNSQGQPTVMIMPMPGVTGTPPPLTPQQGGPPPPQPHLMTFVSPNNPRFIYSSNPGPMPPQMIPPNSAGTPTSIPPSATPPTQPPPQSQFPPHTHPVTLPRVQFNPSGV